MSEPRIMLLDDPWAGRLEVRVDGETIARAQAGDSGRAILELIADAYHYVALRTREVEEENLRLRRLLEDQERGFAREWAL